MTEARGPDIDGLVFVEHLGEGGYSDVFLYERRSPRMKVAVKVLKDARLSDAERRQFEAEAEAMAELADHPYIVQVFSADATADGRPFLVMKYYPGDNLARRAAATRLSIADVLRTGVKIASAVETAHRAGIVHRDIKPANVLISPYHEPGLTDFGIAGRALDTTADDDLGVSIPWSPPEILDGSSNGSIQSDVYSLGATVWHLLVGRSPFEVPHGDNGQRALTQRIFRGDPPLTGRAEAPPSLDRLLQHAMARQPAARPRSALEFAQALQGIEQERRFTRTEIVVPGLDPVEAARPPRDEGPDRTRLRAPQRVIGQHERPATSRFAPSTAPADPSTSRRPNAPITTVPSMGVGSPPPAAPTSAPATTRRPQATPPEAPQPRRRATVPGAESAATTLRPLRPAETAVAEPVARRRGIRPKPAVAIAAALVAAAAVTGVVLLSTGSGSPSPTISPSFTSPSQPFGEAIKAPVVTAHYDVAAKKVQFSWTRPQAATTAFWYVLGNDEAHRTHTTALAVDIRTAHPATTCLRVMAYDPQTDAASDYSAQVCGSG